MSVFIWATSDVLILLTTFYITKMLFNKLYENFIFEIVIATIVVNLTAPIIAQHFNTPLYRLITNLNWLYFWPISALSLIAILAAFIFERSNH